MQPMPAPKLSVVAPCFNAQESLGELYHRLTIGCKAEVADDYEIVLVDDVSSDSTRSVIRKLCHSDSHIVGVFLSRNHGHQLGVVCGHECLSRRAHPH